MLNSIKIWYHKRRMGKLMTRYAKTMDDSLNEEFQRTCRLLQQIDPSAPRVAPPHISEMVDFPTIIF